MAPICHLPLEITGYIVERLSSKDLLCLRQTCRTLNNATLYAFSQKHFRTRRVMLERRSLEALANIAEHLTLGPCIEELEICTNPLLPLDELRIIKPPSRPIGEVFAKRDYWESGRDEETDGEMEEEDEGENTSGEEADSDDDDHYPHLHRLNETAYCKAFNDQEELIKLGGDIEYLTRAMKGLVNCRYIRIKDDNRAWGLKRLWKEIGIPLSPDFQYGDYVTYTRFSKLSQLLYIPKLEKVRLGMFDCTSMDLAFFLLRHQRTLKDIRREGINFVDAKGELVGWPWLVKVMRDSFQITSFVIEHCWDENLGDVLNREAKHLYQDPENLVLEAIDSEGLDKIIKLLQRQTR